jgi:protein-L-isoaspartate(D-aspartate) O-methyltransferase
MNVGVMTLFSFIHLLIFDFDGVLVDTQHVVNDLERRYLMQDGINISLENFTQKFSGETARSIQERLKKEDNIFFPTDILSPAKEMDEAVLEELSKLSLPPMKGVKEIVRKWPLKKCVASNCSSHILRFLLQKSGLAPYFHECAFSATQVEKPKPSPNLFIYAAKTLEEEPSHCLVIEDSEVGVKTAANAGMRVFGFLGGSHATHNDKAKLVKAGAELVLTNMKQFYGLLFNAQEKTNPSKEETLEMANKGSASQEYRKEREALVKLQLKARGIKDQHVLKAMALVPRHLFVPQGLQELAYEDSPLPIGYEQTISQPYIVALMCEAAKLSPSDKVLDIGTGSGYQAAVLSLLSKEVYSVELLNPLAEQAKALFHELSYRNVHVKVGNGYEGWIEHAPYDTILVAAAAEEIPQALLDQLKPNGRLIIPLGGRFNQHLIRTTKTKGRFKKEDLGVVAFVPFKKGDS